MQSPFSIMFLSTIKPSTNTALCVESSLIEDGSSFLQFSFSVLPKIYKELEIKWSQCPCILEHIALCGGIVGVRVWDVAGGLTISPWTGFSKGKCYHIYKVVCIFHCVRLEEEIGTALLMRFLSRA